MAFEPIGIAARRVVASLEVRRQERKRAAENDNQPPEVAPKRGGGKPGRGHAKRETALQIGARPGGSNRLLGRPGGQFEK